MKRREKPGRSIGVLYLLEKKDFWREGGEAPESRVVRQEKRRGKSTGKEGRS